MRVLVKRLLKKYHYPPEGQEKALETVMAQCNKWADNDNNYYDNDDALDKESVIRVYSLEEDSPIPMAAESEPADY